jgi:ferritin-like metal-binding protein YciE
MTPSSLQELYVEQLRDLYDAEHQIIKALPKMIEAATSESLKQALRSHLEVTKAQASRLETIFEKLEEEPRGEKCKGMQGVLQEGDSLVGEIKDATVRDVAIIASAQRVEHYEIAGYGTVRTYAGILGDEETGELLQLTLNEEKDADQELTTLAGTINEGAAVKSVESEGITRTRKKRVA